ncbi:alpha/beta hydrolase [Arenicella xantha]|uniref:Alpha/beta superfamily hydrolase n=1 Tax=Arenicella xantha TaxID=644221 RepID=A0A395JIL8_9GAMM|nr:alpha/beta hydrolase-fold protein [Arenicella xantha]RBP50623.1 hypothetical protein DFR28_10234 [Arenicella xantha]
MKEISILAILLLLLPSVAAEGSEYNPYEMPRTQVVPVYESSSNRQYELLIKLPEDYAKDSNKKYPVIYFTDAKWHIDALSAAAEYLMEDVILVGISWQKNIDKNLVKEFGEHVSRFRDYSMTPSANPERQAKIQFGQANNHLDFIRNVVITKVENSYRTDPNNRTYFGYSAGGKFGAYILFTQPDTFKNYILGSPSLKRDIPAISELASKSKDKNLNANVFVSYGMLETQLGEYTEQFINILKSTSDKSLLLTNVVVEGDHQAAFPMTSIRGVNWLSGLTAGKE